jgi:hypothetical protein
MISIFCTTFDLLDREIWRMKFDAPEKQNAGLATCGAEIITTIVASTKKSCGVK